MDLKLQGTHVTNMSVCFHPLFSTGLDVSTVQASETISLLVSNNKGCYLKNIKAQYLFMLHNPNIINLWSPQVYKYREYKEGDKENKVY